jgi:D-alanine-D-alanine ligase
MTDSKIAASIKRLRGKNIVVLMGGISAEREISLRSGNMVCQALTRLGLRVQGIDVRGWKDLARLGHQCPEVVFLTLHGTGGEDGAVQGMLEWMRIPYTGSGVLASALAMDKARSKEIFKFLGLPTAPWILLNHPREKVPSSFPLPCVVKPNRQGSTVGITIVRQRNQWVPALRLAWKYDTQVLVEKFCQGKEITVGVLEGKSLAVVEIVPKNEFYDFESKYTPGMSEHITPARIPAGQLAKARQLALAAHRALGCRGVSRVDFIAGRRGGLNILEVNTLPGMTATSLIQDSARHAGVSFEALVLKLLESALEGKA